VTAACSAEQRKNKPRGCQLSLPGINYLFLIVLIVSSERAELLVTIAVQIDVYNTGRKDGETWTKAQECS